jgi:hypothetical protein
MPSTDLEAEKLYLSELKRLYERMTQEWSAETATPWSVSYEMRRRTRQIESAEARLGDLESPRDQHDLNEEAPDFRAISTRHSDTVEEEISPEERRIANFIRRDAQRYALPLEPFRQARFRDDLDGLIAILEGRVRPLNPPFSNDEFENSFPERFDL